MKIAIGSDHRGFPLKENLILHFKEKNIPFQDFGTHSTESVDYPDFAALVCNAVTSGDFTFGILICGSGIGVSIAANKHKGIRAVNANNNNMAEMARKHNNANVMCLGADFIEIQKAKRFFEIFTTTDFEGGERHNRRISKLEK